MGVAPKELPGLGLVVVMFGKDVKVAVTNPFVSDENLQGVSEVMEA